jgi:hypothetical protein
LELPFEIESLDDILEDICTQYLLSTQDWTTTNMNKYSNIL